MVEAIDGCASETEDFAERIAQRVECLIGKGAVVVTRLVVGDVAMQRETLVQTLAELAEAHYIFIVGEGRVELHAEVYFIVFHQVFEGGADHHVEARIEEDGGDAAAERLVAVVHAAEVDLRHQLVGKEFHIIVIGVRNGVFGFGFRFGKRRGTLCQLGGVAAYHAVGGPFAPRIAVTG